MSAAAGVQAYLEQARVARPDLLAQLTEITDLHARKLWHQLTGVLEAFVRDPATQQPGFLAEFYEKCIKEFQTRLSHLRLAQIARRVSESYTDSDEAKAFVERILEVVARTQQATLYLRVRLAVIEMEKAKMKEAKEILFAVRTELDSIPDADPVVHSALSKGYMDYHRSQGTPTEYYKNALLFLAYTPKEAMTAEENAAVALELGIAACVGADVYNFGELLAHPTILSLEHSPNAWLYGLLVAFNTGSITAYQQITQTHAAVLSAQPAMLAHKTVLEEKITITALLELVFHRPANARLLPFTDIATATQRPLDQIEFVLMRAMSLGLIRGVIDEVAQEVEVTWVKPRVLKPSQLEVLRQRIVDWAERVDSSLVYVESCSQEIVT